MAILGKLVHRVAVADSADFQSYREHIDEIDRELMRLLSKRMEIAREIGELKREKGMMVFQPLRYNEIMERYVKFCADGKLEVDALREIFEIIHSESIRQQLSVMNSNEA
jgi:chorismate mutase